jgi:Dynein heavy chain.
LLGEEISANLSEWETWHSLQEPHLSALPGRYHSVSIFSKLLIIKAFREEKIIYSITNFVKEVLGEKFVKTPPASMEELYSETTKKTPIIFILSQGGDPMNMVQRLARDKKCLEKIDAISLGKGQEEKAKRAIERGIREGK